MIFYEIETTISNLENLPGYDDVRNKPYGISRREIVSLTQKLYGDSELTLVFVSLIKSNGVIQCGAIAESKEEIFEQWDVFSRELPVKTENPQFREITFSQIEALLENAHLNYLDIDIYDVIRACGITGRVRRQTINDGLLSEDVTYDDLRGRAADIGVASSLIPEIDRIEQGAADPEVKGHPVHYLISGHGKAICREISRILLEALLLAQRIENRRYTILDIERDEISENGFFRLNQGGALILDCGQKIGEAGEFATKHEDELVSFCENLQEWRNKTLTCFLTPAGDSDCYRLIRDSLEDVFLVEIKEDIVYGDAARKVLDYYVQKAGYFKKKGTLARKLIPDDDTGYLPTDIREAFQEWQNHYLQSEVYPQYKDFVSGREWKKEKEPEGSGILELEEMIGLKEAKEMIHRALDYYKMRDLFKKKGLHSDNPAMHRVFTGNPGTAKTSVARLFARIMKENGILENGRLHEVGRADLVGKYVGWTAKIVKKKFKAAKGGVLFIDEAYSLVDDKHGLYGDEAINTIVQEMENHRDDVIVIFAGYPEPMNDFLDRNPGMRSRIAFHVEFDDYSVDELCEITKLMAGKKGLTVTDAAMTKLRECYAAARQHEGYGNGRFVRKILEEAEMNLANRMVLLDESELSTGLITTVEECDIPEIGFEEKKAGRRIGFAC